MVFQQGATTLYQVVKPSAPTVIVDDSPLELPTVGDDDTHRKLIPPLLLKEPVNMLPAMAGFAWNRWANEHMWGAIVVWLLALYSLTLLGLPLVFVIFRRWHDGGVVWARLISLLVVSYIVWLSTSLQITYNSIGALVGSIAVVVGLDMLLLAVLGRADNPTATIRMGVRAGLRQLASHLYHHRLAIISTEGVFLLAFAIFTLIRAYNPDLWHPIWGGEKPMETGFLNAALRSPVLPPYSPFFSDGYINYYYYGFFLVSLLVKATGIAPAIAYNLIIPTLFAMTLTGSYSIVRQLTSRVWAGVVGGVFVAVIGNLASVIKIGWSQGIEPIQAALRLPVTTPVWERLQDIGHRIGDWYVGPSRVFVDPVITINEFPYWSFLFADLHPHLIALPITLLTIALAYQLLRWATAAGHPPLLPLSRYVLRIETLLLFASSALALGTLAATNSWDFPTYGLLCGAALVGGAWRSLYRNYWQRWLLWVALAVPLAMGVVVGGMVFYLPFFERYYAMVSGIGRVQDAMPSKEYLIIHGIFLAILVPVLLGALWRVVAWRIPKHTAKYTQYIRGETLHATSRQALPSTQANEGRETSPPLPPMPYGGHNSPVGRGLLLLPFVAALGALVVAIVRGTKQSTRALPGTRQIVAGVALVGIVPVIVRIGRTLMAGGKLPVRQSLSPSARTHGNVVGRETHNNSVMGKATYTSQCLPKPEPSLLHTSMVMATRLAMVALVVMLMLLTQQQPDMALRLWMVGLLVVSGLLLFMRHIKHTTWFILLLAALAWSVTFGYETVYIRDHLQGGDYYRMNTVFKFGMQVWVLLALAAAASLPLLLVGLRQMGQAVVRGAQMAIGGKRGYQATPRTRRAQRIAGWLTMAIGTFPITILVLMGLTFPVFGTPSRTAHRFDGGQHLTLDGLVFLQYGEFSHNGKTVYLEPDAQAIAWLNETIVGTPIVLQSGLGFYREYGIRIAANTGLPTVVSSLHESEQRDPHVVGIRDRDVHTIYHSIDGSETLQLLQKYRVNYIYIGSVERAFYPAAGLAKFGTALAPFVDLVYKNPGVDIYRVRNIPQAYPELPTLDTDQENKPMSHLDPADLPGPIPSDMGELEQTDIETLELYHQLSPEHNGVAMVLARRYEKLNRHEDALRVLEQIAKANPDDILMQHIWGDMLARQGRLDEAEHIFQQAAIKSQKSADWVKLGRDLLAWGRLDKAELALIRAMTIEPVDAPAYYHLGQVYHKQDKREQAIKYLTLYVNTDPTGGYAEAARTLLAEIQQQ